MNTSKETEPESADATAPTPNRKHYHTRGICRTRGMMRNAMVPWRTVGELDPSPYKDGMFRRLRRAKQSNRYGKRGAATADGRYEQFTEDGRTGGLIPLVPR